MSLSSMTTSCAPFLSSMPLILAPFSVTPRTITYGAEMVMLLSATFCTSMVVPAGFARYSTHPLDITQGGSARGYVLYRANPAGTTIDVQNVDGSAGGIRP